SAVSGASVPASARSGSTLGGWTTVPAPSFGDAGLAGAFFAPEPEPEAPAEPEPQQEAPSSNGSSDGDARVVGDEPPVKGLGIAKGARRPGRR
ncbi:hypothetical protein, partial [Mycobacterium sp. NAZ190054]|uniref:hypothetical protein n=1 Tax=Mycobacterium sp. NAZ190054 TaxID=1747766 RepID=UPI000AFF0AF8